MKESIILFCFVFIIGCVSERKSCGAIGQNMKLIQEYKKESEIFRLYRVDDGVFGYTVTLKICSCKENILIEEIGLRGEDHLPRIDSVIGRNVYVHYSFPTKSSAVKIEDLDFDSVVLGEALLGKVKLKYNYIFKNIANK